MTYQPCLHDGETFVQQSRCAEYNVHVCRDCGAELDREVTDNEAEAAYVRRRNIEVAQ